MKHQVINDSIFHNMDMAGDNLRFPLEGRLPKHKIWQGGSNIVTNTISNMKTRAFKDLD